MGRGENHRPLCKTFELLENKTKLNLEYHNLQAWSAEGKRLSEQNGSGNWLKPDHEVRKGHKWRPTMERWEIRVLIQEIIHQKNKH